MTRRPPSESRPEELSHAPVPLADEPTATRSAVRPPRTDADRGIVTTASGQCLDTRRRSYTGEVGTRGIGEPCTAGRECATGVCHAFGFCTWRCEADSECNGLSCKVFWIKGGKEIRSCIPGNWSWCQLSP